MNHQVDSEHIIIGAGVIGNETARLLSSEGATVKVITRSGSGPVSNGPGTIERIAADASDTARLTQLCANATAIYNCANPPYDRWTTDWPPLAASILAAATAANAVLVTLSNLYGYAPPSQPMQSTDPMLATTVKGQVRTKMWEQTLAAHQAGTVRVTEARASDFIGPGIGENGHMADRVVPRLLKGKSISVLGSPNQAHSWTAVTDVARTLITLGSHEQAWGKAWHVPTVAPLTQRELVHKMCAMANVTPVKVSSMPNAIVRMLGLVVPAMRELREISYQFEAPFVIDSQSTTSTFGIEPTPLEETLLATIESYRS